MSDTVQEVEESLTDEFGRYVKPPKDGTTVYMLHENWHTGKFVASRMLLSSRENTAVEHCWVMTLVSAVRGGGGGVASVTVSTADLNVYARKIDVVNEAIRRTEKLLSDLKHCAGNDGVQYELHRFNGVNRIDVELV